MVKLRLVDETTAGHCEVAGVLTLSAPVITLRELIAERVRKEVESYDLERSAAPRRELGAVEPGETERLLNGGRASTALPLNIDAQIRRALRSFESNGFLVLARDRQLTDLDEAIDLREIEEIRFLRLVPLIGG